MSSMKYTKPSYFIMYLKRVHLKVTYTHAKVYVVPKITDIQNLLFTGQPTLRMFTPCQRSFTNFCLFSNQSI